VCTPDRARLLARAADAGVGFRVLGTAGGDRLVVDGLVDLDLAAATTAWRDRLPSLLDDLAPVTN
jgi:phosphoribosylformylglycinamidine synthase